MQSGNPDATVDLALVLALDCSASVDEQEFRLQKQGLAQAFQRPELLEAIKQGKQQRIAVCVVHWSGKNNHVVSVPWTVIATTSDAEAFAAAVDDMTRGLEPTATSISSALLFSRQILETAPRASRQVIDVTADGPNNVGPPLAASRQILLDSGVTINGLAIQNEWRNLGSYLLSEVAGGEGHFVMPSRDYIEFADAIYRKLLKEITGPRSS